MAGRRRIKEADVSNRPDPESADQAQQVLEVEVLDLDHARPRRSRTSPQRSSMRSELASTRARWPRRS